MTVFPGSRYNKEVTMTHYTLKLDPQSRDLLFDENGVMETLEGDAATTQNVENTLLAWKGEFLLEQTHGTPYDRILGKGYYDVSHGEAEEVIRDGVLQEHRVAVITQMAISLSDRVLSGRFSGALQDGTAFHLEVPSYDESQ